MTGPSSASSQRSRGDGSVLPPSQRLSTTRGRGGGFGQPDGVVSSTRDGGDVDGKDDLVSSEASLSQSDSAAGDSASEEAEEEDDEEEHRQMGSLAEPAAREGVAAEELERLREAMKSQMRLNHHRMSLQRQMKGGPVSGRSAKQTPSASSKKSRLASTSSSADAASVEGTTASTESAATIRGASSSRTPSYPFPMMGTPGSRSAGTHQPFTTLSPTVGPKAKPQSAQDFGGQSKPLPSVVGTPSSIQTFLPRGAAEPDGSALYPTPDLYEATLRLTSEPGMDAWWSAVVQIMCESFRAERVTLSIPADNTDLENVPWGQKATFNAHEDSGSSLSYLRGSQGLHEAGDADWNLASPQETLPLEMSGASRPRLEARHSFSAFEGRSTTPRLSKAVAAAGKRPNYHRTQSHAPTTTTPAGKSHESPDAEDSLPDFKSPESNPRSTTLPLDLLKSNMPDCRGQVFPVLQSLGFEVDPLIDSSGILRVLRRGKVVVLSREYPKEATHKEDSQAGEGASNGDSPASSRKKVAEDSRHETSSSSVSQTSLKDLSRRDRRAEESSSGTDTELKVPSTTSRASTSQSSSQSYDTPASRYEEFEQLPTSPWAQSPAPSPAIQAETSENPFFESQRVDESSFSPSVGSQDYTTQQQVEAIGVDGAQTIIHVPLLHPLLSLPTQPTHVEEGNTPPNPSQDASSPHGGSGHRKHKGTQPAATDTRKRAPIAILSVLSTFNPFPSNFVQALSYLAPHLATSFSMARHCSNVETEVAGLARRRYRAADSQQESLPGIGSGTMLEDIVRYEHGLPLRSEGGRKTSLSGSLTSPSEYSAVSRSSPGGSMVGTPSWELGSLRDRRSGDMSGLSPGPEAMDNYFQSKGRHPLSRPESSQGFAPRSVQSRQNPALPSRTGNAADPRFSIDGVSEKLAVVSRQGLGLNVPQGDAKSKDRTDVENTSRKAGFRPLSSQNVHNPGRKHTKLHSYGADFNATFQSLPATGTPLPRTPAAGGHGGGGHLRTKSEASPALIDLLPPSERLLRTIVDALPVQIYTAAPQSGVITWVNSKFLTYRGHTEEEVAKDPWRSIHPDQRTDYLKAWNKSLRNGESFSYQAQLRRFDGTYRWFYIRAAPLRDTRGVTVHWFGTNMDIHEQHIAEINVARQQETAASEAKYRSLANSTPQIVFAATESGGITFANKQWLQYSGQSFEEALGFGFAERVHPEDLSKCKLPFATEMARHAQASQTAATTPSGMPKTAPDVHSESTITSSDASSRRSSHDSSAVEVATSQLSELAKTGILKIQTDDDGKVFYSTEVRLRTKAGEYRWHLVRCTMVDSFNQADRDGQWFGTCTDINDHKILEQKMKETMDSKTRFLSNMSHEIRTPLIGISGMVEFLSDTPLTAEQIDYCGTIRSSSEGLLDIVNDILDLSKIEAGMMTLTHDWFHIRSLIESVNDAVSSVAIKKGLELNYVVEPEVPSIVKGDQARIRQVLMNVLGNAVKFTSQGEIFTHCSASRDATPETPENAITLFFEVVDSGRGFTQEESELIFKPFSQIDGSSTRRHGGSGLGLVISRQLAELHGGNMSGSSEPGKGSVFKFSANFTVPSDSDQPEGGESEKSKQEAEPQQIEASTYRPTPPAASTARGPSDLLLTKVLTQSPPAFGPGKERETAENSALESSGSSDPSIRSGHTWVSERSSVSSIAPFVASSKDPQNMILQLPQETGSPSAGPPTRSSTGTLSRNNSDTDAVPPLHPPMYSVLVICPHPYSLNAISKHIEMTLPKQIPHQLTSRQDLAECQRMVGCDDPVLFTHIVLNLGEPQDVISFLNQVFDSPSHSETSLVVLADASMRNLIKQQAGPLDFEELERSKRVRFLHKPVKPSRFAEIFDPGKERTSSMDRNRSHAERALESQKQVFDSMEKSIGHKGYRILLVEDNLVNQKVLRKFLDKGGVEVETVLDGVECTDLIFNEGHDYFSLILCDLHMPRKDGFQTCKDIRRWERRNSYSAIPIIALSANVMPDVVKRCFEVGFTNYVTKPVGFKNLGRVITELLEPGTTTTANTTDSPTPRS